MEEIKGKNYVKQYFENNKPSPSAKLAVMEIEELLSKKDLTIKEHKQIFKSLVEKLESKIDKTNITLKD